jgi:hypothetical protein
MKMEKKLLLENSRVTDEVKELNQETLEYGILSDNLPKYLEDISIEIGTTPEKIKKYLKMIANRRDYLIKI